ncbi:alpha/beta fold hydrolase [Thermomonospora amylolytica]|uniref:alpha/beta fold hydrolase n=1 Tax=Thermomonospora amylolytica TaxID=1411117 RepID=UPI000E6D0C48|nr:alpha/beta hydrolase [Thermomonospora amylolytica]
MSTPRFLTLPPGVRRTEIETSRGTFAALEALPGSGVPERCPALLVPGFTGSKEDFIAVLQSLARPGRRVVAIDMRGQYESTGPEDEAAYALPALGADVRALLDALGPEPAHLVGHSFGGLVTREAILGAGARPLSYTLMSSGPSAITGPRRRDVESLVTMLPQLGVHRIWAEHLEPDARAGRLPEEIIGFLRRRMLGNSVTGLLTMAREILDAPDRVEELAKVSDEAGLPVLVLFGENDNAWEPRVQAEMAERLGAARVVIPGAAHSPAVEAPETTASALADFWRAAECGTAR